MRRFPLLRPLRRDRARRLGLLDGVRHHPRAEGGLTLGGGEAQGVERSIIKGARDGKTVLLLKSRTAASVWGPHTPSMLPGSYPAALSRSWAPLICS